jgi:hypothetical protein
MPSAASKRKSQTKADLAAFPEMNPASSPREDAPSILEASHPFRKTRIHPTRLPLTRF